MLTGADVSERSSRSRATYVKVEYTVEYQADIYLDGDFFDDDENTIDGVLTQEIARYDEVLLQERIITQLTGRIREAYRSIADGDSKRIDVVFRYVDYNIRTTELRGN